MDVKPVYLIMITEQNNNKYYNCFPNGDGTFTVKYGRVGGHESTTSYPMSKWNAQINSKIKKGYVDRSNLMADVIADSKVEDKSNGADEFGLVQNLSVREIIKRLWDYANKTIQSAYSVRAEAVTQAMIDAAQEKIDYIAANYKNWSVEEFNKNLNELFIIVPRKMKRVSDCLVSDFSEYDKKLSEEQSLLDTMAGQVYKPKARIVDAGSEIKASESILQKMGITMEEATQEDIAKIKKMLGRDSDRFVKAWSVNNLETDKAFNSFIKNYNITNTKLMWHGSRSQNFFNILKMGLKIRPANAIYTGSMFSDGLYFSTLARKSIGYTSVSGSYWARGSSNTGFMAIFEVAYGNPYTVYEHTSECYHFNFDVLQKKNPPCHCVYASPEKGMLRNPEIVFYRPDQVTIRYLVEIK